MNELGFADWMKKVENEVYRLVGVSVYDLPDDVYRFRFNMGFSPEEAARVTLEKSGWIDPRKP